jgi:competence protein ComEA
MKLSAWLAAGLFTAGVALAADDADGKGLPEGPGKDTVVKLCLSCHGAGNFRKKRLAKEGWSEQVADMIDRGAQATDTQADAIIEYLTREFGQGSKIHVNTAPFEELKATLGLTTQEAQTIVAYRAEKGDFKTWTDLQKAGVDPKKIEAKKEAITFEN